MKYFIGPMSKNVVDAVIEFDGDVGFIPSRRQVDYNGGYVNNWTTGEFATYVDGRVPIERDHGGIGQGYKYDGGLQSFIHDSIHFDIIHIDPWKVYSKYEDGLKKENMISEEDKILLYKIYLKIKKEFDDLDKSKI